VPQRIAAFVRAHHAWLAAAGLAGLAAYHAGRGDWGAAGSDLVTAAGVLGLHHYPRRPEPPGPPDTLDVPW
jgi:hypothetical protein